MKRKYTKYYNLCLEGIAVLFIINFAACTKEKNTTPVLNAIIPQKALPNSVVTITGQHFSTQIDENAVSFNGVVAVVDAASDTALVVTVPENATTGKVRITTKGIVLTISSDFTVTSGLATEFAAQYLEHIGFDGSGNAYGDDGAKTVYKVSPQGVISSLAMIASAAPNAFNQLWGTTVDAAGNVYVTNSTGFCINKINALGVVSIFAGSGLAGYTDGPGDKAQFTSPLGLAIDMAGNLYVNDAHRVRKITPAGVVSTLAGNGTDGSIDGPAASAEFGNIEGIATDAAGDIYVSDNKYLNVRRISTNGAVTTLAGSGTAGMNDGSAKVAQFYYPQALAVDNAGNVFVSDNNINGVGFWTVRMINRLGVVTTFIKGSGFLPLSYGSLNVATVNFPDGLGLDKSGNLYICNTLLSSGSAAVKSITKVVIK